MAYDAGSFDATLAAAAGDDPELLAQLRAGFIESLDTQVDLLRRARCDGNWAVAAPRLMGRGASFHTTELVRLADEALDSAPGEPTVLRKLDRLCADFAASQQG
jgi:hypothetical protein